MTTPTAPALRISFELSWQEANNPSRAGHAKILLEAQPGAGEKTVTVWVNERIDGFCMVPRAKLFALRPGAVELLVPESAGDPLGHDGDDR